MPVMPIRQKLIRFTTAGFGLILIAALTGNLPVLWKGILVFAGGWLMAIGSIYQVKLYADGKTIQYYVLLAFVLLFWIAVSGLTIFWFARQGGLI